MRDNVEECVYVFHGKNQCQTIGPFCFPIVVMNSLSVLHEFDLKIPLHRCDLYQTLAFCGHVFTMKFKIHAEKLTLGPMTENKCGYKLCIFVTSFSLQCTPVCSVFAPPESCRCTRMGKFDVFCQRIKSILAVTPGKPLQAIVTIRYHQWISNIPTASNWTQF